MKLEKLATVVITLGIVGAQVTTAWACTRTVPVPNATFSCGDATTFGEAQTNSNIDFGTVSAKLNRGSVATTSLRNPNGATLCSVQDTVKDAFFTRLQSAACRRAVSARIVVNP